MGRKDGKATPRGHVSAVSEPAEPLLFEARLTPHRSLSRRGLLIVAAGVGGISLGVTTLFWRMGAWPVAGFNGAEILVVAVLLRVHARAASRAELLHLDTRVLRITPADGRPPIVLDAAWLRVEVEKRPARMPRVLVASRGRHAEIGAALGESERRDLADALIGALARWRGPAGR